MTASLYRALKRRALVANPVALGRACGLELDPWQVEIVGSDSHRLLVNAGRQTGKSTAVALRMLRRVLLRAAIKVASFGPSQFQARVVLDHVKSAIAQMAIVTPEVAPELKRDSQTEVELMNGSTVQSLPATEKTVRGIPGVDMLVIDEAARVPELLYRSIRPMIASVRGASIIAPSTPFGDIGWWADAWHGRSAGQWEKHEFPATLCPRITPEFLAEEKEEMGEWWFAQEYLCAFMDAETAAFRARDIAASFRDDVENWDWLDG